MSELEEEEVSKALGQMQMQLNGLLLPLRRYGQGDYVDAVIPELVHLAWLLHWRLEGADVPIAAPKLTYTP